MYKIMIIEDDRMLREDLARELEKAGFEPYILEDISSGEYLALKEQPDLLLLDVMLPQADGYTICRRIRRSSDIPIILLTSKDTEMDEVYGISSGADDFVRKPYSFPVLKARIESCLRRTKPSRSESFPGFRDLLLDTDHIRLLKGGKALDLSLNEYHILKYMFTHPAEIVRRADLIEYLWDNRVFIDDNTLSVNITRLRTHLEELDEKDLIKTKYGQGYCL